LRLKLPTALLDFEVRVEEAAEEVDPDKNVALEEEEEEEVDTEKKRAHGGVRNPNKRKSTTLQ
jgi:hypothetical protein